MLFSLFYILHFGTVHVDPSCCCVISSFCSCIQFHVHVFFSSIKQLSPKSYKSHSRWCYMWRFATTTFSSTKHCNIVSNSPNIVPTLELCVALKSSLKFVPCNITFKGALSWLTFNDDFYTLLFAMKHEKFLLNEKITALSLTNMFPKHNIKHYKQQKWTLKNCWANKFSLKLKNHNIIAICFNLRAWN